MSTIGTAFDLLGIPPDSDPKTAMAAWRALVRRYHPRSAKTDPQGANRKLAEINAAFAAVSAASMKKSPAKTEARRANRSDVIDTRSEYHAASNRKVDAHRPSTGTQAADRRKSYLADPVPEPLVIVSRPEPAPLRYECNQCRSQSGTHKDSCSPTLLSQRAIAAFETAQQIMAGRHGTKKTSLYV